MLGESSPVGQYKNYYSCLQHYSNCISGQQWAYSGVVGELKSYVDLDQVLEEEEALSPAATASWRP